MNVQYINGTPKKEKTNQAIEYIVDRIITQLKPQSIILSGSFGRDEATIVSNGEALKFLSDCEISLISLRYVPRTQIQRLVQEMREGFRLELSISGVKLSLYVLLPGLFRLMKPTIQNYDFKYGSKVIYGKNYLHKIPDFKPEDIPFWEGVRLIFNRMAEALNHDRTSLTSVFRMYKLILACQDALLLSLHKYDSSYRVRNLMFQEAFPKHFPELNETLPKFLPLTVEATYFKLTGRNNYHNTNKLQWSVAEICDRVFRWAIKRQAGIDFGNYLEFQQSYLEGLRIKSGTHFTLVTILQNAFTLMEMLLINRSYISLKLVSIIWLPWKQTVYSLIPLIYFALTPDGEVNTSYLGRARQVLSLLRNLGEKKDDDLDEYQYLSKETINLWYALCY